MSNTGSAQIIRSNARDLPLADNSVDLVVTSPPYFALRSYTDGGVHYKGQIGDEPTPAAFVESLLEVTAECVRVLKPSGSLWVNLGDKYAGTANGTGAHRALSRVGGGQARTVTAAPTKSLIGIPWRYALRCIDDLGLILRAEVIWSKPNGLPESVTDRVRRSHETWFHFSLNPRYFSAVDEIRERYDGDRALSRRVKLTGMGADGNKQSTSPWIEENPLGKLPGSVWTIPTEPLIVPDHLGIDHFAAFPTECPRRIIAGWSPAGVCVECGEGRRPVSHTPPPEGFVQQAKHAGQADARGGLGATSHLKLSGGPLQRWRGGNPTVMVGYACACTPTHLEEVFDRDVLIYDWHLWTPADTAPAVVLDCFGGTGTTALVAKALGRTGISVDMSADYCRLAAWRTNDPAQLAKAMRVNKPPREADGQGRFDFEVTA